MKKMGFIKKIFGDIFFAVIVATVFGALFMKAYAIPTPSMEGTLLVGDHMFVSKFHYGSRLPQTPLQIPLTHQTIWGTDIKSYLDWIQLPYFRLPGITRVKHNDIVVFNYPAEYKDHPTDLRTYYVKRCVGLPGDTLSIMNKIIYINRKKLPFKGQQQTSFYIKTNTAINQRVFYQNDVNDFTQVKGGYLVNCQLESARKLGQLPFIEEVREQTYQPGQNTGQMFGDYQEKWNIDNYGPLYIPKTGDKITLDKKTLHIYGQAIVNFENLESAKLESDRLLVNGQVVNEYTFKQDYFFMMGDNRHNSLDSRSWGFVPEDHIVGKPLFVYWSTSDNKNENYFSRIRWNRFLKWVGDD